MRPGMFRSPLACYARTLRTTESGASQAGRDRRRQGRSTRCPAGWARSARGRLTVAGPAAFVPGGIRQLPAVRDPGHRPPAKAGILALVLRPYPSLDVGVRHGFSAVLARVVVVLTHPRLVPAVRTGDLHVRHFSRSSLRVVCLIDSCSGRLTDLVA